jgi:hypothetical protein
MSESSLLRRCLRELIPEIAEAAEGELNVPDGRRPRVRSVWQLDDGAIAPRSPTLISDRCLKRGVPGPFCSELSLCIFSRKKKRRDKVVESWKKWEKVIKSATFHYGNPRDRRRELVGQVNA